MSQLTSLKRIRAQITMLEAKAEAIKNAEKPGIRQLRAVVAKFKLSPEDVRLAVNVDVRAGAKVARKQLKPKYRNPLNRAETWAGRGLQPRWMVAALKSGEKLDDFLIK